MIYNIENTAAIGNPVRIFDANGMEWYYAREVDTETGRIRLLKIREGYVMESTDGEGVLEEEVYAAAPLRVVSIKDPLLPKFNLPPLLGIRPEGCTCTEFVSSQCPVFAIHNARRISVLERRTMAKYRLPCSMFRR